MEFRPLVACALIKFLKYCYITEDSFLHNTKHLFMKKCKIV